jgi:hypothetical protein
MWIDLQVMLPVLDCASKSLANLGIKLRTSASWGRVELPLVTTYTKLVLLLARVQLENICLDIL